MKHRHTCWLIVLTAIIASTLSVSAVDNQCVWTGVNRIVAVGDVHGDYDQFVAVLKAAGMIDEHLKWMGGTAHLVQLGDVPDRGPDSKKAMDLLKTLENEAPKSGGRVHALIGNHEAMVMMNDLRYVHPGEYASHGGEEKFKQAMNPSGEYGKWIAGHNAVIKINDILFVHGGISPVYAKESLNQINNAIRSELCGKDTSPKGIVTDSDGPLWYRGLAKAPEEELQQHLMTVLNHFEVSKIVVGHTVAPKGIRHRFAGRVVMIDVGMSRAYGGPAEGLSIEKGEWWIVSGEGRRPVYDLSDKVLVR
jgi:Icc-related predicted phosphoesterase